MVEVVGGGGAGSVLGRAAGGRCRRPPPPAAHTHLDDGRLAAARPPHQGHHLARCNGQVQAAQNGHGWAGGVGKVDAAEFQAAREVGRGDAAAARQPRLPQHQGHHLFGRPQGGRDDGIDVSQHPGVHVEHHLVEQEGREAADRQAAVCDERAAHKDNAGDHELGQGLHGHFKKGHQAGLPPLDAQKVGQAGRVGRARRRVGRVRAHRGQGPQDFVRRRRRRRQG